MATTKVHTPIFNNVTLTAGAADTPSTPVVLDAGYGAALHVKLTNGATGPTAAARVQIEVSSDGLKWYSFGGALIGLVADLGEISWGGIEIPVGVEHLRLVAGSNTDQDVVIDADISQITATA